MPPAIPQAGWSNFRALRPFICWIVLSVPLVLWHYHQKFAARATIQFDVRVEGEQPRTSPRVTLNGKSYASREPSWIGNKTLSIEIEDAEPFTTNLFVWYRGMSLGTIDLARSRGTLSLDVFPGTNRILIRGERFQQEAVNCSKRSISIPVGDFVIDAVFARFTTSTRVRVARNQSRSISIKPPIGVLELVSEPSDASFEIQSTGYSDLRVTGRTPTVIHDLPAGQYHLVISHEDYRKTFPVVLRESETNRVSIDFAYAQLSVLSEPAGATVSDSGKTLGRTPLTLSLQPGRYNLSIGKDGYYGTNVNVTLTEKDSHSVAVPLLSVAYVNAMERARGFFRRFMPDYEQALREVEEALLVRPDDSEALNLKRNIEFNQHIQAAKDFARNDDYDKALAQITAALKLDASHPNARALRDEILRVKREADAERTKAEQAAAMTQAEERRARPQKVFQSLTSRIRHDELFQTETIRFNGSVETARAALIRALGREPKWTITTNEKQDADTAVIYAEHKQAAYKHHVVFVAGQAAENEVTIYFKVFAFTFNPSLQLSALLAPPESNFVPMHRDYVSPTRADFIEKVLARQLQEFRKRLEDELRPGS